MKNYPINEIYGMDLYSSAAFISAVVQKQVEVRNKYSIKE